MGGGEAIIEEPFGSLEDGTAVRRFILHGDTIKASILDFGGIITELHVPDNSGKVADVVLGFSDISKYEKRHPFFGALIGRFANRIAGGRCTVDGEVLSLATNNGPNHLHGGVKGMDKKMWTASVTGSSQLILKQALAHGEEGYPGNVEVTVIYEIKGDSLMIDYTATTDRPTPINLTNHSYFNLQGHESGTIFENSVHLHSAAYTPADDTLIPTGEIKDVTGTVYDLQTPTILSRELLESVPTKGFDTNFCVGQSGTMKNIATVTSGTRAMEVSTTQPGVQLYTGYHVNVSGGKDGKDYSSFSGLCLETQHYPDSVNQPNFPTAILLPGDTYHHVTSFRFYTLS